MVATFSEEDMSMRPVSVKANNAFIGLANKKAGSATEQRRQKNRQNDPVGIVPIQNITDQSQRSNGRKDGKEQVNQKNYPAIEVFLFR